MNPEVEQLRYRAVILELLSAGGVDVEPVAAEPHLHVATDLDAEADADDEAFLASLEDEAEMGNGVPHSAEDDEEEDDVEVEAYMAGLFDDDLEEPDEEDEPDEEPPEITRRIRVKIHAPGVE